MKILMLTDYFLPHVGGGVEKVVYEVSKRLVKQGNEVCIITLNTDKASVHEVIEDISVYRANIINLTSLTGMQLAASTNVGRIINEIATKMKPDVINAHHIFFYTTLTVARLKNHFNCPLITTMHIGDLNQLGGIKGKVASIHENIIGKWILKRSDHVTVVSNNVKEHAIKLGVNSSKIDVIPNGVDYDYFKNIVADKSVGPRIISLGRLLFNKGVQFLIEAAPEVLKIFPDAEFIIVGDGPMRIVLEKQARDKGVYDNFAFKGKVDDIRPFLASSSVYVRPSLLEGMPLTVLEAMACGIPVIATDVAGTSEVVHDNVTGLLIEPRNVHALAESIVKLLSDKALSNKLAENGRQMVEKSFTWEKVTQSYAQVYSNLT